jgi:bacterioferritin
LRGDPARRVPLDLLVGGGHRRLWGRLPASSASPAACGRHRPCEGAAVQADPRIIELLNKVLTFELTAINQYFLNARMCRNWGYERLAERHMAISKDEMRDTEELIDRVLFLEGLPNLQRLNHVAVGETPVEQMRLALELERTALRNLHDGIALCVEVGDQGTREFLAGMLAEEEAHCDYWETQLAAVDAVGEANYLAQQLHA